VTTIHSESLVATAAAGTRGWDRRLTAPGAAGPASTAGGRREGQSVHRWRAPPAPSRWGLLGTKSPSFLPRLLLLLLVRRLLGGSAPRRKPSKGRQRRIFREGSLEDSQMLLDSLQRVHQISLDPDDLGVRHREPRQQRGRPKRRIPPPSSSVGEGRGEPTLISTSGDGTLGSSPLHSPNFLLVPPRGGTSAVGDASREAFAEDTRPLR